jgi:MFS family permease
MAAAFAPSAPLALALLGVRALFSQMDVPARQALVMGLVPPAERPAAASVTNVPRSLGTALAPLAAGALLGAGAAAVPLVAGALKLAYDALLLDVPPIERAAGEGSDGRSWRQNQSSTRRPGRGRSACGLCVTDESRAKACAATIVSSP